MPNNINNIIYKARSHFDAAELPNIKKFILENHQDLIKELAQRDGFTENFLSDDSLKHRLLMMNFMVNPNLFYCHSDSLKGRYTHYFQPIYFSEAIQEHINNDELSSESCDDKLDKAIVKMHEDFDVHYSKQIEVRNYLSLNDLETLSSSPQHKEYSFPSPGSIIGFFKMEGRKPGCDNLHALSGVSEFFAHYELFSGEDQEPQQTPADIIKINEILETHEGKNISKFIEYLKRITCRDERLVYYQYVAGSGECWYGKCFFALKPPESGSPELGKDLLEELIHAAEHILSALVLMGTTIRNPGVIDMIGGVQRMMDSVDKFSRLHEPLWRQFGQAEWEANRAPFSEFYNILRVYNSNNYTSITDVLSGLAPNVCSQIQQYYQHGGKEPCLEHVLKNEWFINSDSDGYIAWQKDMRTNLGRTFHITSGSSVSILNYYADAIAFGQWGGGYEAMEKKDVFSKAAHTSIIMLPDTFLKSTIALLFHEGMVRSNLDKIIGSDKDYELESASVLIDTDSAGDFNTYTVKITYISKSKLPENTQTAESNSKCIDLDRSVLSGTHRHKFMCVLLFAKTFLPEAKVAVASGIGNKVLASAYYGDSSFMEDISKKAPIDIGADTKNSGKLWCRYAIRVHIKNV